MKKQFIALNPEGGEPKIFSSYKEKEFKLLNSSWYNIYEGINSFIWKKRTITSIWEFRGIWIDFDVGVNRKYNSLKELLSYISMKIGILPTNINETYKGYHLLFELQKDLFYITKENYFSLYKYINETIWGDIKMRDITWVLKVPGYIDVKNNRNYEIVTIYNNPMNKITLSYLEENNIKVEYRNKEKLIKKDIKTDRNLQDVENLDAKAVIEKINELHGKNHYLFKKEIKLIPQGNNLFWIDNTDGLKLQLNVQKNKWEICDYSLRTRSGVGKFIYSYYCKDIKEDSVKHNIYRILLKEFWIKPPMGSDKQSLPFNMVLWFQKEEPKKDMDNIRFIENLESIDNFSDLIIEINKRTLSNPALLRILFSIYSIWVCNELNSSEKIVWEKEMIEFLWIKDDGENRTALRTFIIELGTLNYTEKVVTKINWNEFDEQIVRRMFDISFLTSKDWKNKKFFKITNKRAFNVVKYLPKDIVLLDKWINNYKYFWLAVKIKVDVEHHKVCNLTEKDLISYLKIESSNKNQIQKTIKHGLDLLKNTSNLINYEKDKKWIYHIW